MMKQYKIKVITKASTNEVLVVKNPEYQLKVKVTSVPEKGKANKKIIKLLAEHFDVGRNSVMIISGEYNNLKTIQINE